MTRRRLIVVSLLSALVAAATGFAVVQSSSEVNRIAEVLDVDPGETFADVGAGDGRFSSALAERVGITGHIYATEVDDDDIRKMRESFEKDGVDNITVIEGTQTGTGLPPACCDGILLRRVYHHFQDPAAMRASLHASLKNGGLLLIVDFGPNRGYSRPSGIPESRKGHGVEKDTLLSEMRASGFDLVQEMDWEGRDYAALFRAVAVPD